MSRATSIDLCVCDLVSASRFREMTTIFAEGIDDPFEGFSLDRLPAAKHLATFARAKHVVRAARHQRPDIIVVQQHLPTASAIARRLQRSTAVVLQTHSFQKSLPSKSSPWCDIRHAFKRRRYARLSGITHVSEACAQHFTRAWPDVVVPSCVVNNGLDFDIWHPARQRAQEILCVGRCAPEKGIAEAAQAVAALLPGYPDWRARFILSATDVHPEYFRRVQAAVSGLGAQGAIAVQRPFCEVKAAMEQAAIVLVPSKWAEPFGRTALEAHAGGAVVVSSGTGGLAEVSGDTALMLPAVTAEAIAGAIETLIRDEVRRERLAQEGMERVRKRFDIRMQAARMDAFCQAVARGSQGVKTRFASGAVAGV